ncbi:MAG TPA: DUF932 domain-containing protein [Pedobacter sp.]
MLNQDIFSRIPQTTRQAVDFPIIKVPVADALKGRHTKKYQLFRQDTREPISDKFVTADYKIVQNTYFLQMMDFVAAKHGAKPQSLHSTPTFNKLGAIYRFGFQDAPIMGDLHQVMLCGMLAHDNAYSITFFIAYLRLACMNGAMRLGTGEILSFNNVSDLDLNNISFQLGDYIEKELSAFRTVVKDLQGRKITNLFAQHIIRELFNDTTQQVEVYKNYLQNDFDIVANTKGTAWALFNAVTNFYDHKYPHNPKTFGRVFASELEQKKLVAKEKILALTE